MYRTSLDIQNKEFSKRFRGYDINEVKEYLSQLADEWAILVEENKTLETKLKDLEGQLEYYRNIETLLKETLLSTQQAMNELRRTTEEERRSIISSAQNSAREIIRKAEEEKAQIEVEIEKLKGIYNEFKIKFINMLESYKRLLEE
ncbi:MAG: DivIVA domain-containing protein [bacterium]|nr:DivIVA domain-containing protein [bacterium]